MILYHSYKLKGISLPDARIQNPNDNIEGMTNNKSEKNPAMCTTTLNTQTKARTNFTPYENFLLEWSVSRIGRSWTIIADILCNYPLTSGQQRSINKIQEQYNNIEYKQGNFFHKCIHLEPTEDDTIPVLGRFKSYLLLNRILPVYPQHYVINCEYLDKIDVDEYKLCGKRKMIEQNFPSSYELQNLKYKRIYDTNPMSIVTKSQQNNFIVNQGISGSQPRNNIGFGNISRLFY